MSLKRSGNLFGIRLDKRNLSRTVANAQVKYRLLLIGVMMLILLGIIPFIYSSGPIVGSEFHAVIELTSSLISFVVSFALIVRFYAMGNLFYLLVGLAFYINGVGDLHHFSLGDSGLVSGNL